MKTSMTARSKKKLETAKLAREAQAIQRKICGKLDTLIAIYQNKRRINHRIGTKYGQLARSLEAKKEHRSTIKNIISEIDELKRQSLRIQDDI